MRSLQRVPVAYRASLTLDDGAPPFAVPAEGHAALGRDPALTAGWGHGFADAPRVLDCVTRDMHAEGALLHVAAGVPGNARVGLAGRLRIEIARGDCVELEIDVRHVGEHRLGVRFLA